MPRASIRCRRTAPSSISRRHCRGVQVPQPVPVSATHMPSPHRLKARDQRQVIPPVPLPARFEALFRDQREPFAQRVEERDRRGVVIPVSPVDSTPRAASGRDTRCAPESCGIGAARGRAATPVIGASPGGQLRPFCVQLYAMSIPVSSTRTGMAPSDVTVSAITRASEFVRRRRRLPCPRYRRRWTFPPARRRQSAAARGGGTRPPLRSPKVSPQGFSSRTTSPPCRFAISVMRSQKKPLANIATLVPGSTKLATAASMPALPVPEMARVNGFAVPNTFRSPARISSTTSKKNGIEMSDHRLSHGLVDAILDHGGSRPVE